MLRKRGQNDLPFIHSDVLFEPKSQRNLFSAFMQGFIPNLCHVFLEVLLYSKNQEKLVIPVTSSKIKFTSSFLNQIEIIGIRIRVVRMDPLFRV